MSNVCVYSFADATGLTKYVDSQGDFLFTGTWSSAGTYTASPLMAAQYGAAYYMAIRNNIGDNPQRVPTRTRPQSWSIMSLLYEYQCSGTATPADALAEAAWELAQSGTNIAWAAYYLAQIGTNTGSAAYDLAGSAYALAGTAYDLAGSAAADAATALSTANGALSVAIVAEAVADDAYALAQIGTNTGTAALSAAATAQSTASSAFNIAVIGTNAASSAQNTADAAYLLAQIGTNTGTAAFTVATDGSNLAWQAYLLATGTNAFDDTARSTANFAYYLAQIGTNTGTAALDAAASAQSTADSAFNLAVAGTTAASLCVLRAGDTMTGALTTPNVFYTHGTSSNAGTVLVDFADEAIKTVAMTAATAFDGTNYLPAHAVTYRCLVSGTAAEIPVTFNSNFAILTEVPTGFATNRITVVSFTAFGSTASDVIVAYAQQA